MSEDNMSLTEFSKENPIRNHSSRVIPLWVGGKPPFLVDISPRVLDYGTRVLGSVTPLEFTITNTGFQTLVVKSISLNGVAFTFPTVLPTEIKADRDFKIEIVFAPQIEGNFTGYFDIEFENLPKERVSLIAASSLDYLGLTNKMLTGLWEFLQRATLPAITSTGPALSMSLTEVSYVDPVELGSTSGVTTIRLSNVGNQPLIIDNLTVTGDFEIIP
jgi:hypothetical protein